VSELAIQTRRLRKEFDATVAVRDLTLSVARGEVVGFLGPNGAGKTTSMKMLLGLVHPTAGSGSVLGASLGSLEARRGVGFLPEHFRFHEWLSGYEVMLLHGRLLGLRGGVLRSQIEALLARVELSEAASRRVRDYSKGMQQRLGLAQALMGEPQLVFLDEPTSGLDPLGRRLVRGILEQLKADGTTVFLNSHLLSEVERTCDRVLFVREGRVIHSMSLGASDDGGIEAELRLDRMSPAIAQGLAQRAEHVEVDGLVVTLALASEEPLPGITRWLAEQGAGLFHLSVRGRALEDVFVELMTGPEEPSGARPAGGRSAAPEHSGCAGQE
jgi:ABC-2 type transport system ATP-binding protein